MNAKLKVLFLISLILSMPFYSASALAAIQITKNTGNDNVDGYINALGDTWNVEALITDAVLVSPPNVQLKIGNSQFQFNSCSSSSLGTVCQYRENFPDGVVEGRYPFEVTYSAPGVTVSDSDDVTADGSAPRITGVQARQQLGDILIDFTVEDALVGLKIIEILDADTNRILQTIPEVEGEIMYDYVTDGIYNGKLQATLSGEGVQRLKI